MDEQTKTEVNTEPVIKQALAPCPFCNSDLAMTRTVSSDLSEWAVVCGSCTTQGPSSPTEDEAIIEWNERPGGITKMEEVTVFYPGQTFNPAQYCKMEVGGTFYKTFVQPGETAEDAWLRGFMFLRKQVKDTFGMLSQDFEERYKAINGKYTGK